MLAANGHAQYRRSLYRVGCEQQALSTTALKQSSHLFQKTPVILLIFLSRTNEQPNGFYLLQQVILSPAARRKKFNCG
jgi:hypothetical protein